MPAQPQINEQRRGETESDVSDQHARAEGEPQKNPGPDLITTAGAESDQYGK